MPHDRKHRKHKHTDNEPLEDIIPMSNDDTLKHKSNNELDDYEESDADDETDDVDETETDDDSDDAYERKGKRHDEYENDYSTPTIRPKRAKPARHGKISTDGINEVSRSKGVERLSNKLNDNLHQIQIALPYGQTPQPYPPPDNDGYNLVSQRVSKPPFWKRKWFNVILKIVICVCVLTCVGIFVYKYIKMYSQLKKMNNPNEEDEKLIKADKNTDVLMDDEDVESKSLAGGNEETNEEEQMISDSVYNSFGKTSTIPCKKYVKNSRPLPKRDARGRFIKC